MRYDYYIVNRQLTKTETKEKTDLEIKTQDKNGDWIVEIPERTEKDND